MNCELYRPWQGYSDRGERVEARRCIHYAGQGVCERGKPCYMRKANCKVALQGAELKQAAHNMRSETLKEKDMKKRLREREAEEELRKAEREFDGVWFSDDHGFYGVAGREIVAEAKERVERARKALSALQEK